MRIEKLFNTIHTLPKLVFSLILGIVAGVVLRQEERTLDFNLLIGWDVFCLSALLLFWITFFSIKANDVDAEAKILKTGTPTVFLLALWLIFASLGIIVLLFIRSVHQAHAVANFVVGYGGLLLSWGLVHTLFTIHYANLYYGGDKINADGGLVFPEDDKPDYLDFAYFSFVNGMTFQVSDVSVKSKTMRRIVLFHCLLAFAFNTVIVALSINLIAGFMQQ